MLKPDTIPDEVVEAAAWAMCDDINGDGAWDETPFRHRPMWRSAARASIAAALSAWPNATTTSWFENGVRKAVLNIPLPQEDSDDPV